MSMMSSSTLMSKAAIVFGGALRAYSMVAPKADGTFDKPTTYSNTAAPTAKKVTAAKGNCDTPIVVPCTHNLHDFMSLIPAEEKQKASNTFIISCASCLVVANDGTLGLPVDPTTGDTPPLFGDATRGYSGASTWDGKYSSGPCIYAPECLIILRCILAYNTCVLALSGKPVCFEECPLSTLRIKL